MADYILCAAAGLILVISERVTGTFYPLVLGIAALVGAAVAYLGIELYISAFGNLAKTNNTLVIPSNVSEVAGLVASAMSVLDKARVGGAGAAR